MRLKGIAAAAAILAALAVPGSAQASTHPTSGASVASADVVVIWNRTMVDALMASPTPPQVSSRMGAIVQVAVFDAVNGITQQYTQYRADAIGTTAPRRASSAAAAVGAAYTALVALFPPRRERSTQSLPPRSRRIAGSRSPEASRGARRSPTQSWRCEAQTALQRALVPTPSCRFPRGSPRRQASSIPPSSASSRR